MYLGHAWAQRGYQPCCTLALLIASHLLKSPSPGKGENLDGPVAGVGARVDDRGLREGQAAGAVVHHRGAADCQVCAVDEANVLVPVLLHSPTHQSLHGVLNQQAKVLSSQRCAGCLQRQAHDTTESIPEQPLFGKQNYVCTARTAASQRPVRLQQAVQRGQGAPAQRTKLPALLGAPGYPVGLACSPTPIPEGGSPGWERAAACVELTAEGGLHDQRAAGEVQLGGLRAPPARYHQGVTGLRKGGRACMTSVLPVRSSLKGCVRPPQSSARCAPMTSAGRTLYLPGHSLNPALAQSLN